MPGVRNPPPDEFLTDETLAYTLQLPFYSIVQSAHPALSSARSELRSSLAPIEYGALDQNRWKSYIKTVVRALGVQLEATQLEVVAAYIAAKSEATRKAADLATAQSEAEVKMDT